MGLLGYPSIPAARHFSRSSGLACAVMATIGVGPPAASARARMAAVAPYPSMSGIWISMRTRSNGPFSMASAASNPLHATVMLCPFSFEDRARHLSIDRIIFRDEDSQAVFVARRVRLARGIHRAFAGRYPHRESERVAGAGVALYPDPPSLSAMNRSPKSWGNRQAAGLTDESVCPT